MILTRSSGGCAVSCVAELPYSTYSGVCDRTDTVEVTLEGNPAAGETIYIGQARENGLFFSCVDTLALDTPSPTKAPTETPSTSPSPAPSLPPTPRPTPPPTPEPSAEPTPSPTPMSRRDRILTILISSGFAVEDLNMAAFNWIADTDTWSTEDSMGVWVERYGLVDFFIETNGGSWSNSKNPWMGAGVTVCSSFGVKCDGNERVTDINLGTSAGDTGMTFFADLTSSSFDHTENNNLSGTISLHFQWTNPIRSPGHDRSKSHAHRYVSSNKVNLFIAQLFVLTHHPLPPGK